MSERPLVSVVTPTYNRPKKIVKAINTVGDQDYAKLEHIIVDGNSDTPIDKVISTELPEVKEKLNITVEIQSENEGICAARNRGMELADGKYIAFLDDDDEWSRKKISRQVQLAESSDAGMIYSGVEQVKNGHIFASQVPDITGDVTETLLTSTPLNTPSTIMITQNLFEQTGGFDPSIDYFEDIDFNLRASKHTSIDGVKKPLVIRHHHDAQMTQDYQAIKTSVQSLIKKHRDLAQQYDVEEEYEAMWESLLGGSAINAGEYAAARRHYFNSMKKQPSRNDLVRLAALVGGGSTYRPLQRFRRKAVTIL